MPVQLTVREVRDALMRADVPGDGEPSNAAVGRLFHEAFTALIGEAREPGGPEVAKAMALRVYERTIGPFVSGREEQLHPHAAEVQRLWKAVESLCAWLASLEPSSAGIDAGIPVGAELREPSWTDSVLLNGVADAVVRDRSDGRWCVVELKLGRSHPRADLGQAALYQLIREAADPGSSGSATALLSFGPDLEERLFRSEDLAEARPALLDLIGRLAGVLPVRGRLVETEAGDLGERLIAVLAEYGVEADLAGSPVVGPSLIRLRVKPGPGVKVASIGQRARELRMRLGLDAEPSVGIDGNVVTIDLPRRPPRVVPFRSILDQLPGRAEGRANSRVPVGVDLDGKLVLADLDDTNSAHWVVAGTTGSGKSEWLRAAVAGLIATNTPATLRLVLIDPKRTAFGWLRDSEFLRQPLVFPGEEDVEGLLDGLLEEMERRTRLFSETGVEDLSGYIGQAGVLLPRIVCACDEFADLLLGDPAGRRRLEDRFQRLGARARAAGIHLILATQQPSREVLKGALISNMNARVGLRMPSPIESRMLLNADGAELLLGRGDLLFKAVGEPARLQGLYLSPEDREAIARGRIPGPISTS
ncbi:MAG: DNA translocase FtsK [Isosphaeraceae bacterium]